MPLEGATTPPARGPAAAARLDGWVDGEMGEAKVVRAGVLGVEMMLGWAERWKEAGKEDSKNCWRSSSARMTMRKVGRVMCRGRVGSRARFAVWVGRLMETERVGWLVDGLVESEFSEVSAVEIDAGGEDLVPRSRRSS